MHALIRVVDVHCGAPSPRPLCPGAACVAAPPLPRTTTAFHMCVCMRIFHVLRLQPTKTLLNRKLVYGFMHFSDLRDMASCTCACVRAVFCHYHIPVWWEGVTCRVMPTTTPTPVWSGRGGVDCLSGRECSIPACSPVTSLCVRVKVPWLSRIARRVTAAVQISL